MGVKFAGDILVGVCNDTCNCWNIFGSKWARTLGGKRVIDKVKMKAPAFGPLFMKMYMARFARTGATLSI
jgi:type II secretory pathway component PulF